MSSKTNFLDRIREELAQIVEDRNLLTLTEDKRYGKAFEHWCLELLSQWHTQIDNDPTYLPESGDGGVDILVEETAGNRFFIAQCAYVGKRGKFDLNKWKRLCQLATDLLDENKMIKGAYARGETREELIRVARRIGDTNASVDLFYMTTADATNEHKDTAQSMTHDQIAVHLWDQLELRRIRDDVASVEAESIDRLEFDVPAGSYFSVSSGDHNAHVLSVKASAIAQRYDIERHKMLAWNIRNYLGANSINSEIRETAEQRPGEFFICNNGITAISRRVTIDKSDHHLKVVCEKFQVINGGQTLASLHEVYTKPLRANVPETPDSLSSL
jgi:hypothetical protein